MEQIQIINNPSKEEPFLIINKPSGLPTAPLSKDDINNVLSIACLDFPQIKEIKGKKEIEYGLVHRIDTVTSGLVLIALTQEFYDSIIQQQNDNNFTKIYSANCNINDNQILPGFPETTFYSQKVFTEKTVTSYFRFYGPGNKEVRPVELTASDKILKQKVGKLKKYSTKIIITSNTNNIVQTKCEITNGFRHQVRCHLAWLGLPIIDDPVYNTNCNPDNNIRFRATGLEFTNPLNGNKCIYNIK